MVGFYRFASLTEACSINIEHLSTEHGHRTVKIMGKGGKAAACSCLPTFGRAIDLDRHGATWFVRRVPNKAGISKRISPHPRRHSFITAALDDGVPLRDVQIAARHADSRTTTRYHRA